MAATTTDLAIVIENFKAISAEMFGVDSAYAIAQEDIKKQFHEYGLINEEYGKIMAQTLSQMASQTNSEAMNAAMKVMTLQEDVKLKQEQTKMVTRQIKGYNDNLLLKIVEFQAGVTQFAVNAGNADNIQSAVSLFNTKIKQVEKQIEGFVAEPLPDSVLDPVTTVAFTAITSTGFTVDWTSITGATTYKVYIDGVAAGDTGENTFVFSTGVASTKYAVEVVAYSNTVAGKSTTAKIVTTTA